jgi:hypothetical protein
MIFMNFTPDKDLAHRGSYWAAFNPYYNKKDQGPMLSTTDFSL